MCVAIRMLCMYVGKGMYVHECMLCMYFHVCVSHTGGTIETKVSSGGVATYSEAVCACPVIRGVLFISS